jgi:dolichyl-phosphate beta-glucosyltransferase
MLLLVLGALTALLLVAYSLLIIFSPSTTPTSPAERLYASATKTEAPLSPLEDPATCSLSVVVPAYNERERLPLMIDEAMRYLLQPSNEEFQKWYARGVEIVIVDDGSTDDTAHVGIELAKKWEGESRGRVEIRVVRLERNRGKGGAVRHVSTSLRDVSRATGRMRESKGIKSSKALEDTLLVPILQH